MNLKIRLQNKAFWVGFISAFFIFLEAVLPLFGVNVNLGEYENVVNSILALLTALGVFTDVTTPSIKDSRVTLAKEDLYQTAEEVVWNEDCND